jgi:hypothetical protein
VIRLYDDNPLIADDDRHDDDTTRKTMQCAKISIIKR